MMKTVTVFFILATFILVSFSSASQQTIIEDSNEITTELFPQTENSTMRVLSRKRRYVVFPKGSSIQTTYCVSMRNYVPLTKRFQIGITLGLAWMLPDEAHELYLQKRDVDQTRMALAKSGYGVRHRVDLYTVLEGFLSLKGLNGRDCVMRAICEAAQTKQSQTSSGESQRGTFMEELHKILFALPNHPKHKTPFDDARRHAGKCGVFYSGCHSILDLQL